MAKATRGPAGTPLIRTYRAEDTGLTRGYAVIQGTADDQCKVSGAAGAAIGIVAEDAVEDALVGIVQDGETIGIAGGTVNAGAWVKAHTDGTLVASAGEDSHNIGRARTTAASAADEFVVDVKEVKKRTA
jgi:hypothetical protein